MQPTAPSAFRLTVALMMDWTDRHCRYFHRLFSTPAFTIRMRQCRLFEALLSCFLRLPTDIRQPQLAKAIWWSGHIAVMGAGEARRDWPRSVMPADVRYWRCRPDYASGLVGECVQAMARGGRRTGDGEMPHRRGRPGRIRRPAAALPRR